MTTPALGNTRHLLFDVDHLRRLPNPHERLHHFRLRPSRFTPLLQRRPAVLDRRLQLGLQAVRLIKEEGPLRVTPHPRPQRRSNTPHVPSAPP
eukprot:8135814-Pyramimonas_sp.AAC.1